MTVSMKTCVLSIVLPIVAYLIMNKINYRSYKLERQDRDEIGGRYSRDDYIQFMDMLAKSNLVDPNGYNATLAAFDKLKQPPSTILEVGFGSGQFSIMLAEKYQNSSVIGIDAHPLSLEVAMANLHSLPNPPRNVRFEGRRESELNELPKSVDVITTTLVNHHIFPDEAFVEFLKRVAVVGRQAFIFNDHHRSLKCILATDIQMLTGKYIGLSNLHRHAAYLPPSLAVTVARYEPIFRNRSRNAAELLIDGGMLSLRRSFSLSEYKAMFVLAPALW